MSENTTRQDIIQAVWRLRARYKALKDRKRPRGHAYVYRITYWNNTHEWAVDIFHGARLNTSITFPTHAEALAWALEQVKESTTGPEKGKQHDSCTLD